LRVEQNRKTRLVNVEVIPLKNLRERCFLILFEETEQLGHAGDSAPLPKAIEPRGAVPTPSPTAKEESGRVADLESELSEMRDYLQSIQEQYEAANEELQASSEEAQSANEELQSINEELETSKEELESANEELTTVNEEMVNRNAELNRIHGDLFNLQTSTKLAVVLLGRDAARRIREQPGGKTMVLVAVTGWGQEEDRRKSKDVGFDAHMVKPVDFGALMKLLAALTSEQGGQLTAE
ncbi:MAG: hypothetical protein ACREV1_17255, partial [Gammaproteobacteria bacterium]